jgi:hypothetical protein
MNGLLHATVTLTYQGRAAVIDIDITFRAFSLVCDTRATLMQSYASII